MIQIVYCPSCGRFSDVVLDLLKILLALDPKKFLTEPSGVSFSAILFGYILLGCLLFGYFHLVASCSVTSHSVISYSVISCSVIPCSCARRFGPDVVSSISREGLVMRSWTC